MKTYILLLVGCLVSGQYAAAKKSVGCGIIGSSAETKNEYTVQELINNARTKNYQIRTNAEKVYRARQKIKVAIGRLLPSLNLGAMLASVQYDFFDLVPSLLGFMFPSNWFRWRESILFFEAERRNFSILIANEINAVESIAYRIHSIKVLQQVVETNLIKISRLVVISEIRTEFGEDTPDNLLKLQNIKVKMEHDILTLKNSFMNLSADLAKAIALDIDGEWGTFDLAAIPLPDLRGKGLLDADELFPAVRSNSLELKSFKFLALAAKYGKFNRAFQFLSPAGDVDGDFGFGYSGFIRIGKSRERELSVKFEETTANLMVAIRKAVNDYNLSIDLYEKSILGRQNAEDWYGVLEAQFEEGGDYDPDDYIEALKSLLDFESRVSQAQHYYLISKAQVERLLWATDYYQDLLVFTPRKKILSMKKNKEDRTEKFIASNIHSLQKKLEDRKIKKAIRKRKLVLPR